ncbi:serine/threonine-protein kinase [Streptomyces sp. ACA25]|uniref:serine/threonine-protein kinase n=1 Tax=Streptomyces sp. ACA25 TaxID=3022596 RepID=UPI0023073260|nr:serine/threonine-protein kinase [Streptomyces sp. ACA25]MDB1090240.1 serine/threonine-protein kinase [Streptomyces sp. ACA25]
MEPLTADDPRSVGAYRLLRRIGSGGMGRVYLGRSAGGRTVAVKIVHPHFAVDQRFRARFAREVAAARRVGGDWTAPVLDADPDADVPWVATGYVAGPDLQRTVDEHGALPERSVRVLGAGLAEALTAVHALGLVHRDVKPSNVLLTLDGPRLIDFGIARATEATAALTGTGVSVGSPGYMAPEQVTGGDLGPAADVFSLGAVLAFAASGRPPFPGESPVQLLYRVVHEEPQLAGVPGELRPVIAACLAKHAGDRPEPAEVAARCAGNAGAAALVRDGWLPPPVVEGASRRAVELLGLEDEAPGPAPGGGPGVTGAGYSTPPQGVFGPPDPAYAVHFPPAPHAPARYESAPHAPAPIEPAPHVAETSGTVPGRRRRRLPLALAAAVAVAGLGLSGYLLGLPDAWPGGGGGGGTTPTPTVEEEKERLPEEYLGVWEGDLDPLLGLPMGSLVVTLEAGGMGDEVGTVVHTPPVPISSCVDVLTLTSVSDGAVMFDALVDWERSTRGTCVEDTFEVLLRPRGEDSLHYTSSHADGSYQGLLDRRE